MPAGPLATTWAGRAGRGGSGRVQSRDRVGSPVSASGEFPRVGGSTGVGPRRHRRGVTGPRRDPGRLAAGGMGSGPTTDGDYRRARSARWQNGDHEQATDHAVGTGSDGHFRERLRAVRATHDWPVRIPDQPAGNGVLRNVGYVICEQMPGSTLRIGVICNGKVAVNDRQLSRRRCPTRAVPAERRARGAGVRPIRPRSRVARQRRAFSEGDPRPGGTDRTPGFGRYGRDRAVDQRARRADRRWVHSDLIALLGHRYCPPSRPQLMLAVCRPALHCSAPRALNSSTQSRSVSIRRSRSLLVAAPSLSLPQSA